MVGYSLKNKNPTLTSKRRFETSTIIDQTCINPLQSNMSHETYNKLWHKTQDFLNATLQLEPSQADRREHRTLLATLYLRYIVVANRLSECLDQMIQPQKRLLIRKLLEATLGRILELKSDLVEADLCEWTHCGDVLNRLGLTPYDVELKIPPSFRNERKEELDYRRWVIDNVLGKLGFLERKEDRPKMTEQQAILIIQASCPHLLVNLFIIY